MFGLSIDFMIPKIKRPRLDDQPQVQYTIVYKYTARNTLTLVVLS